jgi:hypothetical protein
LIGEDFGVFVGVWNKTGEVVGNDLWLTSGDFEGLAGGVMDNEGDELDLRDTDLLERVVDEADGR